MLPRSHRLSHSDIADVVSGGKTFHGPHFSVRVLFVPERQRSGAAAVVPKKVAKGAVKRNRLRRRVSAAIADLLPGGPKDVLVVVFAKHGASEQEPAEIRKELHTLLQKAGIEAA